MKIKVPGPLFLKGQRVVQYVNCQNCPAPLTDEAHRIIGLCAECLEKNNIEIGVILTVERPPLNTWEN